MSKENPNQPAPKRPFEVYGFTELERMYWRVNDARFKEIINNDRTLIHCVQESSNSYGEFLFVTVSKGTDHGRIGMTFFGLGYHEYRERWFTDEWYWYQSNPLPSHAKNTMTKEEADEIIQQRLESISPDANQDTQSGRGVLFEMLAEMTDDDGAIADLEDMDADLADWLGEGL